MTTFWDAQKLSKHFDYSEIALRLGHQSSIIWGDFCSQSAAARCYVKHPVISNFQRVAASWNTSINTGVVRSPRICLQRLWILKCWPGWMRCWWCPPPPRRRQRSPSYKRADFSVYFDIDPELSVKMILMVITLSSPRRWANINQHVMEPLAHQIP